MNTVKHSSVLAYFSFLLVSGFLGCAFAEPLDETKFLSVPAARMIENLGITPIIADGKNAANLYSQYVIHGTGQNSCYNDTSQISCPEASEGFYGQDATYDISPLLFSNMPPVSGQPQIVMDSIANLWVAPDDVSAGTWAAAGSYCASLASASMGSPWRLPSTQELAMLADASKSGPAINSTAFPYVQSAAYWTSDTLGSSAWTVNFADGATVPLSQSSSARIICLSAMTEFSGGFLDIGDGTVIDARTSTMWQKASLAASSWQSALSQCQASTVGGYTDWRLPTRNELVSVVDPDGVSAWPSLFSAPSGTYWSGTTTHAAPGSAWVLRADKQINGASKTTQNYPRCVRSMPLLPASTTPIIMSGAWSSTADGVPVTSTIVSTPRYTKFYNNLSGQVISYVSESILGELTVSGSPSYSYHPFGVALSIVGGSFNVQMHHASQTQRTFQGFATGTDVSGIVSDYDKSFTYPASAIRMAKSSTMSDYDLNGFWTGTVMGTPITADLRTTVVTSGAQKVANAIGRLSVPYGNKISSYGFQGFIDSDGSVFMIRNTVTHVYIFEGTRSGNTITGTLRDYGTTNVSNVVLTKVAGGDLPEPGGPSSFLPILLFEQ